VTTAPCVFRNQASSQAITTKRPIAVTIKRLMVGESRPSEKFFTEGNSGLRWNTPKFQYCSTDSDCKDGKKPGVFSDWKYAWIFNLNRSLQTKTTVYAATKKETPSVAIPEESCIFQICFS